MTVQSTGICAHEVCVHWDAICTWDSRKGGWGHSTCLLCSLACSLVPLNGRNSISNSGDCQCWDRTFWLPWLPCFRGNKSGLGTYSQSFFSSMCLLQIFIIDLTRSYKVEHPLGFLEQQWNFWHKYGVENPRSELRHCSYIVWFRANHVTLRLSFLPVSIEIKWYLLTGQLWGFWQGEWTWHRGNMMIVKTLEKPAWHTPAICSFFLLGFFPLLPCLSSPVGLVGLLLSSPSGPHPLQVSSAQKAGGECVCSWQSRRKTLHLQLKKNFRSEKCWLTLLGELKTHSQAHVPFGSAIAATSRYQGTCFCFISAPACFISRASHMTPLNFNFHMCKMWINSTYSIIWNLDATIYCINIKHYDYYYRTLYDCSVSFFSKWHLLHPFKNRLEKINPRDWISNCEISSASARG